MFIDVVAVVLLAFATFKGLRKGFIIAIFSLVAIIIGLTAAMKLSAVVAEKISGSVDVSERWLPVLAFAVVFIGVMLLVRIGAKLIEGVVRTIMLGWLNRLGGILLYVLLYLFIYSIILFYANQLHLIKAHTINSSITFNYIEPLAPKIMNAIGAVIPIFKNMFSELSRFFTNVSSKME
jgi:membrane protein required for colicin V production